MAVFNVSTWIIMSLMTILRLNQWTIGYKMHIRTTAVTDIKFAVKIERFTHVIFAYFWHQKE